jgi:four helix bundle protein
MQDFHKLEVWQLSHQLTLSVYRLTKTFLTEEKYGLTDQMRRAAVSIESNLAEGCGRGGDADCRTRQRRLVGLGFARFAQMAFGSACELECQLLLARDLGFLAGNAHAELEQSVQQIKRMLSSLLRKLKADSR